MEVRSSILELPLGDNTGLSLVRYCWKTGILWTANWNSVKKLKYYRMQCS